MIDFGDILTVGVVATAIPTLMGILIAYSLIAIILGAMLWTGKSVPDDVGIAVAASGAITGLLVVAGVVMLRLFFG